MKLQKSVQADSSGRINLGKECAGQLFILSHEKKRLVLEPARIVSEKEFDPSQRVNALLLNDEEWSAFEILMDTHEEPTKDLSQLMKKSKHR